MTFLAALRHDRIDAPWVVDGPINGKVFSAYVEKVLVPTLVQGDVVVLDNLGSHKGKPARAAIRAAGAHLLFLPPYSPNSTTSKAHRLGTSEGEVPLIPRVGHRGLISLARWIARRDVPEAETHSVGRSPDRTAPPPGGADEQSDPAALVYRSGGGS
jgi:hypothetical protein